MTPLGRLPDRERRAGLVLAIVAVLFAAAGAALAPFDAALSDWARHWQGPARRIVDELIAVTRCLGKGESAIVVVLVAGALGRRRDAATALVALLIVALVITAVKHGVLKPRPNGSSGYAFPSGDAATAAAALLSLAAARPAWLLPLLLPLVVAVAYGRMHQGYHFGSDVGAGIAVGAMAAIVAKLMVLRPIPLPSWRWYAAAAAGFSVAWVGATSLGSDDPHDGADMRRFLLVVTPVMSAALAYRWWRARLQRPRGSAGPRARRWLAPLACVAVVALLLGIATRSSLWDRDEPRFARASVEMATSGDWLVPSFNGEPRLHKPVGAYWAMAPSLAAFGVREWPARLPATLAAGLLALLAWRIGRRLVGNTAGAWGAVALVTCPLLLVCGTAATTDAVLVACITAAMAPVARALARAEVSALPQPVVVLHWRECAALALAIGGAVLVKGPLGLIVPVAAALVAWPLARGMRLGGRFWTPFAIACLAAVAIFIAWAAPANARTGGAFASEGVGKHVIDRGKAAMESHGGGPWYYIPVVLGAFFPWTALLPAAARALARRRAGVAATALLTAWAVPTFVIMSLYATKLPHYILPIFPALALMVGVLLQTEAEGRLDPSDRRWVRAGRWIVLPVGAVLALAMLAAPFAGLVPDEWLTRGGRRSLDAVRRIDGLVAPLIACALPLAMIASFGFRALARGHARHAAAVFACGMAATFAALAIVALPAVERWKPSRPLARAVNAAAPGVPVRMLGFEEASLIFYLDRREPIRPIAVAELPDWSRATGDEVLVTTRAHWAEARAAGAAELPEVAAADGINIANGKWVELVALRRGAGHR